MDDSIRIKLEKQAQQFRDVAKQLWRENPKITPQEMIEKDEIRLLDCDHLLYKKEYLVGLLQPSLSVHFELDKWLQRDVWTAEESAAILLDINPFAIEINIMQFRINDRKEYEDITDLIKRSHYAGTLSGVLVKNETIYFNPADIVRWAQSKNIGEMTGRLAKMILGSETVSDECQHNNISVPTVADDKVLVSENIPSSPANKKIRIHNKIQTQGKYARWQARVKELGLTYPNLSHTSICKMLHKLLADDIDRGSYASIRRQTSLPCDSHSSVKQ